MDWARRTLADPATYRRLVYLLSGMPLGLTWFVALVTVWSLCIGLFITPLVIPLLIGLTVMVRGFAAVEAVLARSLLDVVVYPPAAPRGEAASGHRSGPGSRLTSGGHRHCCSSDGLSAFRSPSSWRACWSPRSP